MVAWPKRVLSWEGPRTNGQTLCPVSQAQAHRITQTMFHRPRPLSVKNKKHSQDTVDYCTVFFREHALLRINAAHSPTMVAADKETLVSEKVAHGSKRMVVKAWQRR